jgi:hypothetical protein
MAIHEFEEGLEHERFEHREGERRRHERQFEFGGPKRPHEEEHRR